MGKEGQLLDDSALVNAFDQAIFKYKKMHGKGYTDCSTTDVSGDVISNSPDVLRNDTSNPATVGNGNDDGSSISVEVEETVKLDMFKENNVMDSQIPKEHELQSNGSLLQDETQNYFTTADIDEYNRLYKQYYEIEEQRQNIIQQMHKFSNESYPYSGEASVSGVQCGTDSTTQEDLGTSQKASGAKVVSCCPCACQCSVPSCPSLTGPSAGTLVAGPPSAKGLEAKPTEGSVDFVTTALGAAERALSILKEKTSDSDKENKLCSVMDVDSETDISTVLNAWYSAGFYTGKYLTEKSLAKKRHD